MRADIKKLDSTKVELSVELSGEDLEKFVDKAETELGKSLEVDGFRKGKVPKSLIRKNIDSKAILDTAFEIALRDSLADSIKKKNLDVLNVSNLKIKDNSPQKLAYSVLLTQFPDISISDLNFKVKKNDVQVQEKEINETIDGLRLARAKLIEKDKPAENGDRVEVDFEVKCDGKIIEGGTSKNHPLILGKNTLMPGFEENLVGMSVNQEKVFSITAPRDYFHKVVAGKKLNIHVKLQDVKKVEIPEMNEDFIRSLGKFNNREQLLSNIKNGLIEEKKEKERQRVRLEIIAHIIKNSDIIAPEHMVDDRLEDMINGFDSDLHKSDMELGPYLAHLGKTRDDLKNDWKKDAEKQVKTLLIIHKVAREKNVSAEPHEIEPTLNEMVQGMMLRGGVPKEGIEIESLRNAVVTKIINEKTLQFLEDHCSD